MTPRTRLESFRLQLDQQQVATPAQPEASSPSIPALSLKAMATPSSAAHTTGSAAPEPSPRGSLTSRRLKKEVLCADSQKEEASNSAGHVTLTDGQGTPRSVRVVQQEAREDFNMVSVKWLWTLDERTHQIELRHGRKSGIRKLYVDRELIDRSKNLMNALVDRGSRHPFRVAGHQAEVSIVPGRSAGFKYFLEIDGEPIEREIGIKAAGLSAEVGTHFVMPRVAGKGFGMTLANCGKRSDGVVIIELEPGLPAHAHGLHIGDVILSVDDETVVDTNVILDRLSGATEGTVTLEVAGSTPSRLVTMPNPALGLPNNGSLELADTSCGVGVYVAAVSHWSDEAAEVPGMRRGTGQLELGDVILSVDGAVTESAKETSKYLKKGPRTLTFVVAGRAVM